MWLAVAQALTMWMAGLLAARIALNRSCDRHDVHQRVGHFASSGIGEVGEVVLDASRGILGHGELHSLICGDSSASSQSARSAESPCPSYRRSPNMAQSRWLRSPLVDM